MREYGRPRCVMNPTARFCLLLFRQFVKTFDTAHTCVVSFPCVNYYNQLECYWSSQAKRLNVKSLERNYHGKSEVILRKTTMPPAVLCEWTELTVTSATVSTQNLGASFERDSGTSHWCSITIPVSRWSLVHPSIHVLFDFDSEWLKKSPVGSHLLHITITGF